MKKSLRKLAAMEVPSENEARAEEGKETFTEDNPTGSGEVKCRKCGQKSSAEEAEGGHLCPGLHPVSGGQGQLALPEGRAHQHAGG